MRKRICCLIIFCILSALAGCTKEQAPVIKGATGQVQPPAVVQEGKGSEEVRKTEQEIYTYDPRGKRDPFLSLVKASTQKLERRKGMTPIESYGIDEITLLAIAWDDQKYYALIMLPDKKSYTIKEGDKLGIHNGTVQKITKDMVLIREYVKDYRGKIKLRNSILKLRKEGVG